MLTQQYIRTLLSYDPLTGYLTWKPRPISMFTVLLYFWFN